MVETTDFHLDAVSRTRRRSLLSRIGPLFESTGKHTAAYMRETLQER